MNNVIAITIDGVWQHPQANEINAARSLIDSKMNEVDQIVVLLSQAVRIAQSLSETDQRRVRDFFHAAQSTLTATTYLPKSDQKIFENALRDEARKYG
jgi:hypothetical protein